MTTIKQVKYNLNISLKKQKNFKKSMCRINFAYTSLAYTQQGTELQFSV